MNDVDSEDGQPLALTLQNLGQMASIWKKSLQRE
jgi:hypothetical protein